MDWASLQTRWPVKTIMHPRQRSLWWLFLLYLVFAALALRGVLFAPGAIGLRNDWLHMPLPGETAWHVREVLTAWSEEGLGSVVIRSGYRPLWLALHATALLFGISAAVLTKLVPLFAIALAGLTANILLFSIVRRGPPAFVGSLVYMFSPLLFNVVVSGYEFFLVSYALLPLLVVAFTRALSASRPLPWVLTSALLFSLLQDNVQVASLLILLPLFLGTAVLGPGSARERAWRTVKRAGAVMLLAALVQAQFVVPVLLNVGEKRSYVQQVVEFSSSRLASPDLVSAFTLDGAGTRYFVESVPKGLVPWWTAGHIVFFALALSGLAVRRYRRQVMFWSVVALASLFLFKGVNPPFGAVNQWLLDHVFLMAAFRNVQYVTILTNLALAVLLAIWVVSVPDVLRRVGHTPWLTYRRLTVGLYSILGIALVLRAAPFLTGNFHREIQTYTLHPDYASLVSSVHQNPRDGRFLLLPPVQPVRSAGFRFPGLDPLARRLSSATGSIDLWSPWQRFLTMLLYTTEPIPPDQLLCDGAIVSVLARRDFTSETPRFQWEEFPKATWTNEQLQRAIADWKGLTERSRLADGQATIYDVTQPCGRLTTAEHATVSSGTLSDAVDLVEYWQAHGASLGPVVYSSQQTPGLLKRLPGEAIDRVALVQNNLLDFTRLWLQNAIEVPITNLARDAKQGFSPLSGWWWKDWHYAAVLDPKAVVATGRQTGRGVFTVAQAGPAELWLKTLQSRSGSALTVRVDDKVIGDVSTREPLLQGLAWTRLPLGRLAAGQHTVTVSSTGGENLLARLLIVAEDDAKQAEKEAAEWFLGRDVVVALTFATRNLAAAPGVFGSGETEQPDASSTISLTVPRDGSYTVSVKAATRQYVASVAQLASDYLDTVVKGKEIGQTFELASGVQLLHSLQFKLEARHAGSNLPAATPPDAPLTVTLYRLDDANETRQLVGLVTVLPDAAPLNDQWSLVDVPMNIALNGQGGRFLATLSSSATEVGWAVGTVSDGFSGTKDYYPGGAMMVGGEPQKRDLVFTVQTQVGSPQAAHLQLDDTVFPLSIQKTAESWQELGSVELLVGSHTMTLSVDTPHLRIDQVVLRSTGSPRQQRPPPSLTYQRSRPSSLTTARPVTGRSPYWLILSDTWDPGWRADPKTDQHVVMNGFANGWWIEPPSQPYHIAVRYDPQRYVTAGLLIGGVTVVAMSGWLLWFTSGFWLAWVHRWRGRGSAVALGLAVLLLIVGSLLALTGKTDGAGAAAAVGIASFVVALLFHLLKISTLPAKTKAALVMVVLVTLVILRLASQLDRPAAQRSHQPPVPAGS